MKYRIIILILLHNSKYILSPSSSPSSCKEAFNEFNGDKKTCLNYALTEDEKEKEDELGYKPDVCCYEYVDIFVSDYGPKPKKGCIPVRKEK